MRVLDLLTGYLSCLYKPDPDWGTVFLKAGALVQRYSQQRPGSVDIG